MRLVVALGLLILAGAIDPSPVSWRSIMGQAFFAFGVVQFYIYLAGS
jgi:hypothetical protein